jgi:hypothetical protein
MQQDNSQGHAGQRSIKNLIQDKKSQVAWGSRFFVGALVVQGLFLILIVWQMYGMLAVIEGSPLKGAMTEKMMNLFWSVGILFAVSVAGAFFYGLVLSHRVAGPVKVINDYIDQLIAGQTPAKRSLRPNDELKSTLAKLEELSAKLARGK